jgi:hypothetical protein
MAVRDGMNYGMNLSRGVAAYSFKCVRSARDEVLRTAISGVQRFKREMQAVRNVLECSYVGVVEIIQASVVYIVFIAIFFHVVWCIHLSRDE